MTGSRGRGAGPWFSVPAVMFGRSLPFMPQLAPQTVGQTAVCLGKAGRGACLAGLMQPSLLEDGQVCVDMGPPVLDGPQVPTTLEPTQVLFKSAHPHQHPQASPRTLIAASEVCLGWPAAEESANGC